VWVTDAAGALAHALPSRIVAHLRACRDLDSRGRARYVALRLRRADPLPAWDASGRWSTIRSVLLVCRGNVIRSPMAAALLRRRLGGRDRTAVAVDSAGLRAEPGRPADPRAVSAARHFGIALEAHRARALTAQLVRAADLILVMDALNDAELRGRHPDAAARTLMLGAFVQDGRRRPAELIDPYDGTETDVRRCYERVEAWIERLASRLGASGAGGGPARKGGG